MYQISQTPLMALASVAQLVEASSPNQSTAGSMPSPGMYGRQSIGASLSRIHVSLSPFLSPSLSL